ncbi:hypothetical protein SHLA_15c000440 [Shinella sp. DD12]|nr:hypothetical protein SHLA_15c000440 [Shinella sp. DD12]
MAISGPKRSGDYPDRFVACERIIAVRDEFLKVVHGILAL